MEKYHVRFLFSRQMFILLKIVEERHLPPIHADGYYYYDTQLIYPLNVLPDQAWSIRVSGEDELLEFPDDKTATVWFMLEYGV